MVGGIGLGVGESARLQRIEESNIIDNYNRISPPSSFEDFTYQP